MAAEFKYPAFHSFPPSFTRQPVATTRQKQAAMWCGLIRDYCRHHRIYWLDTAEASNWPLFHNKAIERLSLEDILYVVGELVSKGDGEWDADRKRCLIFWRRPGEWGDMIYKWVEDNGQNGQVMTVYEVRLSDDSKGQEFHGLDLDLMLKALGALEASGKASVFGGEVSDSLGVKFL